MNPLNNLETLTPVHRADMSFEQKLAICKRVGQAINMAVDRLLTIGEIIVEGFQDIKADMFDCCKDARDSSKSIEQLCLSEDLITETGNLAIGVKKTNIILASRSLLSSITRVLLLVDIIVVKQLFTFKYKGSKRPQNLEYVTNFTKFVQAFSAFGTEMVEMIYLVSNTANSTLKEEKKRSEILLARQVLDHSVKVLITSSKVCVIHYNCVIARENRNTVFCQIRRGMDHIHFIIKDAIMESEWQSSRQQYSYYNHDERGTIHATIQHFTYLMQCCRYKTKFSDSYFNAKFSHNVYKKKFLEKRWFIENKSKKICDSCSPSEGEQQLNECYSIDNISSSSSNSPKYKTSDRDCVCEDLIEKILISFDRILENIHDFTDSPYTSHEMREKILIYCDHCTRELNKYLRNVVVKQGEQQQYSTDQFEDEYIDIVLATVKALSEQLINSAVEQSREMFNALKMSTDLVNNINLTISQQNLPQFRQQINEFHEHCDHILEVCKLLRHIAVQDALKEQAGHVSINLRIYGPQVILAAKILIKFPLSNVASENFDAFVEMWTWLVSEVSSVSKKILESRAEVEDNDLKYLTMRTSPTVDAKSPKTVNFQSDVTENTKEVDMETETVKRDLQPRWSEELCDNDIIKRAKNLSAMAFLMYQFTKGNGSLKTTQDLFTQAEYFAEEANRLYKILRQFSYQVPASPHKKDLLNVLDRVPTFVQSLQFTVKDHTVGPSATYVKVDHVIRETKNLMCVINSVVTKCLECATKYNLDFNSVAGGITSGTIGADDCAGGAMDSKGTSNSTEGSM